MTDNEAISGLMSGDVKPGDNEPTDEMGLVIPMPPISIPIDMPGPLLTLLSKDSEKKSRINVTKIIRELILNPK